ncbi:hypothetical protein JCM11641_001259 [Rhodosporidiobolus odoratus]
MDNSQQGISRETLERLVRNAWVIGEGTAGDIYSWRGPIMDHIRSNYAAWSKLQEWQASRILHYIRKLADKGHPRPLATEVVRRMEVPPLTRSLENVRMIIDRTSRGDEEWANEIYNWVFRHWNDQGEPGQAVLVEALHMREKLLMPKKSLVTTDAVLQNLRTDLDEVAREAQEPRAQLTHRPDFREQLMTLPAGLAGPHDPDEDRSRFRRNPALLPWEADDGHIFYHSLGRGPQLGRRAAAHYGTTQARWQAGQGW